MKLSFFPSISHRRHTQMNTRVRADSLIYEILKLNHTLIYGFDPLICCIFIFPFEFGMWPRTFRTTPGQRRRPACVCHWWLCVCDRPGESSCAADLLPLEHSSVVELQLWKWMKHEGNYLQYCVMCICRAHTTIYWRIELFYQYMTEYLFFDQIFPQKK